ncbi:MAG: MerR family transcriptional regulator [Defluviitaleaceae bacterium]|nr:MerR family transcriptional regulator [Defluviitaleaceae bacterium]
MSKYTTGEMAKLCNVSVRTVQFYDTKGLLPPSELSEGGRRLYTDDDLTKLRLICMLRSIGLTLDAIQGILKSDAPVKVLNLILDQQLKQSEQEVKEKQEQIDAIKIIKQSIHNVDKIPVSSIKDIGYMMENKKGLRKVRAVMVSTAIPQFIFYGTIALWVMRGIWWPFVIALPAYILATVLVIKYWHRNIRYICPECNITFHPSLKMVMFTSGDKVRYLTCSGCGYKGYCIEVYAKAHDLN